MPMPSEDVDLNAIRTLRPMLPLALLGLLAAPIGCAPSPVKPFNPPALVPVQGTITVDGEPLETATVTFLPTDEEGTLTVGETDAEGFYALQYLGGDGTATGSYKVSVGYKVSTAGKPLGLGVQSSLVPPDDVIGAQERLPANYSDLGRTVLSAEVPPQGGTFNFDLEGPIDMGPAADSPIETAEADEQSDPTAAPDPVPSASTPGDEQSEAPVPPIE